MKKKFLPVLLILCTVLMLGMNAFAGSAGGERIAVVAKNTGTIDMTDASIKEPVFEAASNYITITSDNGTQTAKIYTAWDAGALYFYVEVNDPDLSAFIQKNATTPNSKTDQECYREYESKINTKINGIPAEAETIPDPMNPNQTLKDRLQAETGSILPWTLPAVEIMIDPSNEQPKDSANANIYQARTTFSGYNSSFIPFKDSKLSYNMYSTDRFTSVTNCEFDNQGKATGEYQIKMKFTAANLGQMSFTDWQQISVHSIVYFSTSSGTALEKWSDIDSAHMNKDNWDAPNYSYYRLWDPASTTYVGANASEVAASFTESSITTAAPVTGLRPITSSSTTRAPAVTPAPSAPTTTAAPADEGGCGSIISGAAAVLATAMIAVPVVIIKRKDD